MGKINLGRLRWPQLVRELNQEKTLIEFRGRFEAENQDFRAFLDLCEEIDEIRKQERFCMQSLEKVLAKSPDISKSPNICHYCHKEGHQEKKCFKKKKETRNIDLKNPSGYFVLSVLKDNVNIIEMNPRLVTLDLERFV